MQHTSLGVGGSTHALQEAHRTEHAAHGTRNGHLCDV